ncbi:MAG: DUF4255 domain-containing protein [Saprospiraceae bacterium]|nr:DUF4255 domain-containing protein [Saprospiraceae bacterium]
MERQNVCEPNGSLVAPATINITNITLGTTTIITHASNANATIEIGDLITFSGIVGTVELNDISATVIGKTLTETEISLKQYLDSKNPDSFFTLGDISKHEKDQPATGGNKPVDNSLVLTLINIEEESVLKNNYPVIQEGTAVISQLPSVYLNLYVLFAANLDEYTSALRYISHVIEFFQVNKKMSFLYEENNIIYQVFYSLHNIGFENLNNLWTVLGGRYIPSVIYKIRVLPVQVAPPIGGNVITEVQNNEPGNLN